MGRVNRKHAFEHVQNGQIQILQRMRKVLSGPSHSIDTFISIRGFC